MKMPKITILAAAMMMSVVGLSSAKDITMKIAHGNNADPLDPYQVISLKFKELLEKKSDKIEVQIFTGGQLGAEQRAFQDVQNGIIQGAVLASNNVSAFSSSMAVLDLPFLFKSNDEFMKVLEEAGEDMDRVMTNEAGVRAAAWGVQGFRVIANSSHPVNTIEDLHGLKIRVPNNATQVATFGAWGSDGVPMAFGELFGALQQRVIDGLEMTYISLASLKYYEVIDNVTDVRYKLAINPLVISNDWYQTLPDDVKVAIDEAGRETTVHAMEMAKQMDETGKSILSENGVTLSGRPSDENVWIEKARTVWPQVYPKIKDEVMFNKVLSALNIEK